MNHSKVYEELTGKKLHPSEARKRMYGIRDYLSLISDKEESRVLVIPDLHAPFTLEGYLEFCVDMYKKWDCNQVVFLGDEIDNHFSSFHDTDPDGHSGAEELDKAKKVIAKFYKEFPVAKVCIGNHSSIPNRKAFSSGLSKQWIRTNNEVLEVPNWEYADEHIVDSVKYTHGVGRQARQRTMQDMISVVQGHFHSKSYIENFVGVEGKRLFAMQLGAGINIKEYAFAYGKNFARPHINVGIVINGKLPIIEYFEGGI